MGIGEGCVGIGEGGRVTTEAVLGGADVEANWSGAMETAFRRTGGWVSE